MILSASDIRDRDGLISPFVDRTIFQGMSCGLSHAGYDIRVRQTVWLLPCIGFALASSVERFRLPLDLMGIVHDKSTWARRGVAVQNTVLEPGWAGFLTVELSNHGYAPVLIRAGSPVAQIVFHELKSPADPYTGKYQDQPDRPVRAISERH